MTMTIIGIKVFLLKKSQLPFKSYPKEAGKFFLFFFWLNPKETKIHREEVYKAIQEQNYEASQAGPESLTDLTDALRDKK